jgi:hypothetical protein
VLIHAIVHFDVPDDRFKDRRFVELVQGTPVEVDLVTLIQRRLRFVLCENAGFDYFGPHIQEIDVFDGPHPSDSSSGVLAGSECASDDCFAPRRGNGPFCDDCFGILPPQDDDAWQRIARLVSSKGEMNSLIVQDPILRDRFVKDCRRIEVANMDLEQDEIEQQS